jgi:hypothetical protein
MNGTTKKSSPIVTIDGKEVQLCSICGKPTKGETYPGAVVSHMPCLESVVEKLDKAENIKYSG